MAIKVSSGLRNKMLVTGSFKATMDGGSLKIYSGTVPTDADQAATGTLLVTITNNSTGTGVTFATTATTGVVTKTVAEVWSGVVGTGGVASYYRLVATGDTAALSTTEARVQGLVSTAGADLNMSSTTLVAAATQTIDYYSMALPTA
jgi:hypothetical protein